jgi:phosphonate degradation associated HDIG domain protein
MSYVVRRIDRLFRERGAHAYEGARRESVSALDHALQCAQLAEWAQAGSPLVAAALLHDIGHFIDAEHDDADADDTHELRAVPFLAAAFGADVVEPVRLHVQAKRYLVAADTGYAATLSPASIHSLGVQGGGMTADEARHFECLPYASQALALRRWDDLAKQPGRATPPLSYYLAMLDELVRA